MSHLSVWKRAILRNQSLRDYVWEGEGWIIYTKRYKSFDATRANNNRKEGGIDANSNNVTRDAQSTQCYDLDAWCHGTIRFWRGRIEKLESIQKFMHFLIIFDSRYVGLFQSQARNLWNQEVLVWIDSYDGWLSGFIYSQCLIKGCYFGIRTKRTRTSTCL